MKNFEVHRIKKTFSNESTLALAEETEALLNQKAKEGFELVTVSFHIEPHDSNNLIYSFSVFKR